MPIMSEIMQGGSKMILSQRDKYIVHRCGMKNGGTQHWFSWPVSSREAKKLCKLWIDVNYIPKIKECDFVGAYPHNFKLDSLIYLQINEAP